MNSMMDSTWHARAGFPGWREMIQSPDRAASDRTASERAADAA